MGININQLFNGRAGLERVVGQVVNREVRQATGINIRGDARILERGNPQQIANRALRLKARHDAQEARRERQEEAQERREAAQERREAIQKEREEAREERQQEREAQREARAEAQKARQEEREARAEARNKPGEETADASSEQLTERATTEPQTLNHPGNIEPASVAVNTVAVVETGLDGNPLPGSEPASVAQYAVAVSDNRLEPTDVTPGQDDGWVSYKGHSDGAFDANTEKLQAAMQKLEDLEPGKYGIDLGDAGVDGINGTKTSTSIIGVQTALNEELGNGQMADGMGTQSLLDSINAKIAQLENPALDGQQNTLMASGPSTSAPGLA